jgi:hypothetical protein
MALPYAVVPIDWGGIKPAFQPSAPATGDALTALTPGNTYWVTIYRT